jgi:hypothetical protein
MSFFENLVKKIFPADSKEPVIVKQVLKRSESYIREYEHWKEIGKYEDALELISISYQETKSGRESQIPVFIHNSNYANGIIVEYSNFIEKKHFSFIFDYLRDKVLGSGYFLYTSDEKISEDNDNVNSLERHFLKPAGYPVPGTKSEQLYGNITLECFKINEDPKYIKILAAVYSDSAYHSPLEFDDLIDYLLE